ncbi:MAG: extracellular solute-binding protein [Spirochaetales bacterium]
MKQKFVVMLVALLSASVVFAMGSKEDSNELLIWSFTVTPDALAVVQEEIIEAYEAANPGVTVTWQNIPYDGYREKLLTAAAGGALPDIFVDGFNMVGKYKEAGVIADLTDDVLAWDGWNKISSSVRDLAEYDGSYWGFPFRTKIFPLIINTALFEQAGLDPNNPPETWSELLDAAEKLLIVENGVVVQQGIYSFYDAGTVTRTFELLIQQDGGEFIDSRGYPAFNNEHGMNALEMLVKLYVTEKPVGGVAPLDETVTRSYPAGKAGMSLGLSYNSVEWALQLNNTEVIENTKVVIPTKSDNATGKPVAGVDGDMAYISAKSTKKDLAIDFLKYFYEPDNFLIYLEANKCLPLYEEHMDSDYMKSVPLFQGLFEMQKYGGAMPKTPAYLTARAYLHEEIEKAVFNGQDLQVTLDNAERRWLQEIEDMQ